MYEHVINPDKLRTKIVEGETRFNIPAPGTENDDTNPPRIVPHHLFDMQRCERVGSVVVKPFDVQVLTDRLGRLMTVGIGVFEDARAGDRSPT